MPAGGVAANVGGLGVEPVLTVRERGRVEALGQPDPEEARLVRMVLARAWRIELSEVDVARRLPRDLRHERLPEVEDGPPGDDLATVTDEPPAHERRCDRHAAPRRLRRRERRVVERLDDQVDLARERVALTRGDDAGHDGRAVVLE